MSEKYHRHSIRLKEYDYSQAGGYFVTICSYHHEMIFDADKIQSIVKYWWNKLPEKYANIEIDQFAVMPNHVHGVIFIVGAVHEPPEYNGVPLKRDELPLQQKRRKMLLPAIIGYFKMNTAKHINEIRNISNRPIWQRNYYEHIIRNENELNRIREYIINNPLKWQFDRENPERIPDKQYENEWNWLEGK